MATETMELVKKLHPAAKAMSRLVDPILRGREKSPGIKESLKAIKDVAATLENKYTGEEDLSELLKCFVLLCACVTATAELHAGLVPVE
jgi:hypothetical protein